MRRRVNPAQIVKPDVLRVPVRIPVVRILGLVPDVLAARHEFGQLRGFPGRQGGAYPVEVLYPAPSSTWINAAGPDQRQDLFLRIPESNPRQRVGNFERNRNQAIEFRIALRGTVNEMLEIQGRGILSNVSVRLRALKDGQRATGRYSHTGVECGDVLTS